MKKTVILLLTVSLLFNLAGCEPLRKKFIRKPKKTVKAPRIYQVKKYVKNPTPELYKKHYAYWMSWHSELIKVLGQNHKKDLMCIEQIVSNLKDMQNILVPEKAQAMQPAIDRLVKVRDILVAEDLTQFNKGYIKSTLEREDRNIKRNFRYKKVKDSLKKSFEDEDKEGT